MSKEACDRQDYVKILEDKGLEPEIVGIYHARLESLESQESGVECLKAGTKNHERDR